MWKENLGKPCRFRRHVPSTVGFFLHLIIDEEYVQFGRRIDSTSLSVRQMASQNFITVVSTRCFSVPFIVHVSLVYVRTGVAVIFSVSGLVWFLSGYVS